MKKKTFVLIALVLLASTAILSASLNVFKKSSVSEDANPKEDLEHISTFEVRKGEYTVRLIPQIQNTFGFDIRKGKRVIFLQTTNPFYPTPEGFQNPNDAFNVAWWVVDQFKRNNHAPNPADFNENLEKELSVQRPHNHAIHPQTN